MVIQDIIKVQLYYCHMLGEAEITMHWGGLGGLPGGGVQGTGSPKGEGGDCWQEKECEQRQEKRELTQRDERAERAASQAGVGLEVCSWMTDWGPWTDQSTPGAHPAFADVSRCGLLQGPWVGCPHTSPAFTLHSKKLCQMPHPVTCHRWLAPHLLSRSPWSFGSGLS